MAVAKEVLYREAYDPLVAEWFRRLEDSPALGTVWQETEGQDLLATVLAFDSLFHTLVDEQIDALSPATLRAIEVVGQYADHVVWAGQCEPPKNPSVQDIEVSLSHKLKRNASLAFQEGILIIGSSANFLRREPNVADTIPRILKRSYRLIGSLAVLNDEHEKARIKELLASQEELSYPQTPFSEITTGSIQIPVDKFELVNPGEGQAVAFRASSIQYESVPMLGPTIRCPAHRLRSNGIRLNETFWNLLIDINEKSDQF